MEQKATEIIYLGFMLPALFSITLVIEGIYRMLRHEDGFFNVVLGTLLLVGLTMFYLFLLKK